MEPRRHQTGILHWRRWLCCTPALIVVCGCGEAPIAAPDADQGATQSLAELAPVAQAAAEPTALGEPTSTPVVLWQLPQPADATGESTSQDEPGSGGVMPAHSEDGRISGSGPRLLAPRDLTADDVAEASLPAEQANPSGGSAAAAAVVVDAAPLAPLPAQWGAAYRAPRGTAAIPAGVGSLPSAIELLADATPVATGEPTGPIVCHRAQERIRRAYELAERGAYFAARSELVGALRALSDAKDQQHGAPRCATMLANGLRALEEASDFLPRGAGADAELNVAVIVSSHRTPVGKAPDASRLMPQQLADLYLRYAQRQLGDSVAGEPAGSMALHALGKIDDQLGRVEPEKRKWAERRAFSLQQAALAARSDNYLAAHELGVLLAESGHYPESQVLLSQVAAREPNPVVLRNLAQVERKLGREAAAVAVERQADFYAARVGDPRASGVQWVAPQTLAQTGEGATSPRRVAARGAPSGPPLAPQYRR